MAPPHQDPTDHPLIDVRERLVRLEATASSHNQSSFDRHHQLIAELRELKGRVEHVETRLWRQALLLAVVAVSGSAGAIGAVKAIFGALGS